jgi:carbon-monoxide dehydrogenase large subunit
MSYAGQPLKRVEDPRLVAGKGSFVDDLHLPKMLYASVLRSFHAYALLRSIDVSAARSLPGVVTVLTGADIASEVQDLPTLAMSLLGHLT